MRAIPRWSQRRWPARAGNPKPGQSCPEGGRGRGFWSAHCTGCKTRSNRRPRARSATGRALEVWAWATLVSRCLVIRVAASRVRRGVEERRIVGQAENLTADCREHLVGVVVEHVEREVAVNPLKRARTNQTAGSAGVQGLLDGVSRPRLEQVSARLPADRASA